MFDSVLLLPEMVLLVKVSAPARVASVPVVGRVTLVLAVAVRVSANAPEVVNEPAVLMFPPSVMVREPLLTPVPPEAGFRMPASTTAPVVAVDGVNPVDPALKELTPPACEKVLHWPLAYPSKVWVVVLNRN